jgi:hypothetical protein
LCSARITLWIDSCTLQTYNRGKDLHDHHVPLCCCGWFALVRSRSLLFTSFALVRFVRSCSFLFVPVRSCSLLISLVRSRSLSRSLWFALSFATMAVSVCVRKSCSSANKNESERIREIQSERVGSLFFWFALVRSRSLWFALDRSGSLPIALVRFIRSGSLWFVLVRARSRSFARVFRLFVFLSNGALHNLPRLRTK